MKHGLRNLDPNELLNFEYLTGETLNKTSLNLNDELISNLQLIGLTDEQCWNIIMFGLISQTECILYRLALSGIDVPGILNWLGSVKPASTKIINFLKTIGIDENVISFVEKNGIDDESCHMLKDLGLEVDTQDIPHQCKITIFKSKTSVCENKVDNVTHFDNSSSNISSCICDFQKCIKVELTAERNDYLR